MFFKSLKNTIKLLLLALLIIPGTAFAYSEYIIASGENIGIELNSKGVIIVGTYKVGNNDPAKKANLQNGDKIIKINNIIVTSIEEMLSVIQKSGISNSIMITYLRGSNEYNTNLSLIKDDNNILKTGLYVKDSITGIGTLTFIDPKTKIYGALGHEIIEKTTGQRLEIKDGKIYNSVVTGVTRSSNGKPGEKNANYNINYVYGNVLENTSSGIFGNYTNNIPDKKLYKVANINDIKTGSASILTVIENETVEEFAIEILKVSSNKLSVKNILFEITDDRLLTKTGGIIQGMSGSPIVQNEFIIGAVTHVVIDNPMKGYGIFIVNMLEEAEN